MRDAGEAGGNDGYEQSPYGGYGQQSPYGGYGQQSPYGGYGQQSLYGGAREDAMEVDAAGGELGEAEDGRFSPAARAASESSACRLSVISYQQ
jgi:hypothetical protein